MIDLLHVLSKQHIRPSQPSVQAAFRVAAQLYLHSVSLTLVRFGRREGELCSRINGPSPVTGERPLKSFTIEGAIPDNRILLYRAHSSLAATQGARGDIGDSVSLFQESTATNEMLVSLVFG
jgi:hypothetical protein